jgi:NADH:ubiquinone oxidoreductase subunit
VGKWSGRRQEAPTPKKMGEKEICNIIYRTKNGANRIDWERIWTIMNGGREAGKSSMKTERREWGYIMGNEERSNGNGVKMWK